MADSLSQATIISWLIARAEAKRAGYSAVEPEHIMIGICTLDKFVDDPDFADKFDEESLDAIRTERETIGRVLNGEGWDAAHLRRRLRRALGKGFGVPPEDGVYHRSAACRRVFDAASAAAGTGERPVTTIDFLVAATASPTPIVKELFPEPLKPETTTSIEGDGGLVQPPAEETNGNSKKPTVVRTQDGMSSTRQESKGSDPTQKPIPRPPYSKGTEVFFSYSAVRKPETPGTSDSVLESGTTGGDVSTEGDGLYVSRLAEYFEARGIPCWYAPRNIRIGERYPAAIVRGIRSCRVMIVVISPRTKQEEGYIENEVEMANTHHLAIVPLLLENVRLQDNLAFLFGTYQKFSAPSRVDEAHMQALYNEISHHLSK